MPKTREQQLEELAMYQHHLLFRDDTSLPTLDRLSPGELDSIIGFWNLIGAKKYNQLVKDNKK